MKTTVGARRPRENLTQKVTGILRDRIETGVLRPGDRLPTEQGLIAEFGVSRTVIREAISGLRADGLVEPRHGVGVFVLDRPAPPPGLEMLRGSLDRLSSIIEILELRTAAEIEAAGLAAERASPAQQARIRESCAEIDRAVLRGERAEAADFAFHLTIMEATNNPLFPEFLQFLGQRTIPRSQISSTVPEGYLERIQAEHMAIVDAIAAGDTDRARSTMRTHLRGALKRYEALLRSVR
ncbi:FadR family transcriptional regulator [Paroceanicella profunda]|uniref:FadR family transcriptional regulator n=1 Tax=Paroceanicella profunda TaxID=2579971 RepID=A0A5B8FRZ6_9RHOB|nr:FadR/GntR family transcriptional regulator [Paroceanicella profunda]QDL91536.1 FadR family transcriptional regulator [Paroceanicella profunda]